MSRKAPQEEVGWHGTDMEIPIGGYIVSRKKSGQTRHQGSNPDLTYFTPNKDLAWAYAATASRPSMADIYHKYGTFDIPGGANRPRVYKTQPIGTQEYDETIDQENHRQVPTQKVIDVEWTPTLDPHRGDEIIQGTLPHINWNQFNSTNYARFSDGVWKDDRGAKMSGLDSNNYPYHSFEDHSDAINYALDKQSGDEYRERRISRQLERSAKRKQPQLPGVDW